MEEAAYCAAKDVVAAAVVTTTTYEVVVHEAQSEEGLEPRIVVAVDPRSERHLVSTSTKSLLEAEQSSSILHQWGAPVVDAMILHYLHFLDVVVLHTLPRTPAAVLEAEEVHHAAACVSARAAVAAAAVESKRDSLPLTIRFLLLLLQDP